MQAEAIQSRNRDITPTVYRTIQMATVMFLLGLVVGLVIRGQLNAGQQASAGVGIERVSWSTAE